MTTSLGGALLGRRLDRLRTAGSIEGAGVHGAAGPPSAGRGDDASLAERAWALAAGVGGRVLATADGPVVAVESTTELWLDVAALADLPYGVDGGRPLVCVDVETTGLGTAAGTLPFLVGVGTWHDGALSVCQLLLPDHPQEQALLSAVAARIPADACLVTYNGRSFDWPLLVSRFRLHRRDPPLPASHLDLLLVARGLWKHRLGNARLATVEGVAGVRRLDDLPGALVPERYFRYLRGGNPSALRAVLRHNRQDIVSLGLLLGVLSGQLARPDMWSAVHPGDLGGLARAYSRRGRTAEALECLDAALRHGRSSIAGPDGGVVRRRLLVERARLLARCARHDEAAIAWLELATSGGPGAAAAWLWLARHREHRLREPEAALHACLQAAAIAERARAWGRALVGVERDLARRLPRLRRLAVRRSVGDSRRSAA